MLMEKKTEFLKNYILQKYCEYLYEAYALTCALFRTRIPKMKYFGEE